MTSATPPNDTALATAPPARQTKSAECAPITCTRLGTGQPPRVLHSHDANVLLAEAGGEVGVGEQRQPVLHRRVEDLPEVRAPDRVADADRAGGGEDLVPRALAGVRRGQRALQQRASLGQRELIGGAELVPRE